MQGIVLFVDAARPGADAAQLARILGFDLYRARMLAAAGAPFVAQGIASLDAGRRLATALDPVGFNATVHDAASIEAVVPAEEAVAFVTEPAQLTFVLEGGARRSVSAAEIRVLVQGKLTVKITQESNRPAAALTRGMFGGIGGLAAAIDAATGSGTSQRTVSSGRLEIFADTARGPARVGIRHDRFDFSALLAKKTLSAVRNLDVLREMLARAAERAAVDEAFARTELSRTAMVPDVWNDDPGLPGSGGGSRAVSATSNRQAFDLYARLRYLHERARRAPAGGADHFLEL